MQLLDGCLRGGEIRRRLAGAVADAARHLGDDAFDGGAGARVFRRQACTHGGGGFLQQHQKMAAGDIAALAETSGEVVVVGRARDQHLQPCVGKQRAGVAGDRMDDLSVATLHQNVGHGLAQPPALRNREQMPLALAVGVGEQC